MFSGNHLALVSANSSWYTRRRWPQWPHLISPHLKQPWDFKFTLYACLLHIILVNKDLCFTLNARGIRHSEFFYFIFFLDFFFSLNIFPSCHLFVGHDDLRILRAKLICSTFPCLFSLRKTKAKLKYCKLRSPFPFSIPMRKCWDCSLKQSLHRTLKCAV